MADIKEKLKQLKKEREARSKTISKTIEKSQSRYQKVEKTWEEIDKNEELSIKEKLQKLINLTTEERETKVEPPAFEPLEREPLQLYENPYPLETKYGKIPLSLGLNVRGEILSCLSRDPAFESLDLSSSLFIDLETSGLSGGAGIIPFLIGLGFYRNDRFNVVQYFLGDPAEEERLIEELRKFFTEMEFQSVVSFNGKVFDIPLLETRFILHRQPLTLNELPHLDFLFSARSLWRHKHESCRLYHLAREIVQADRAEDIPSAEIPYRYFQYLRTGNFTLMEPVLYHNQEDILSLLGLVITGSMLFSEKCEEWVEDSRDFFGVGKIFENIGDLDKSASYFERALEGDLSEEISILAKKKLSYYFKKNRLWDRALALWKDMASLDQLFSFRELAMYYEHREKDLEEAKKIAEEGLAVSLGVSSFFESDFSYRLERLRRKIQRKKDNKKKE
ncbi:MAG: ribonuclease H-like domain-containing protein [Candidatus Aminicenantaceae bacterium]